MSDEQKMQEIMDGGNYHRDLGFFKKDIELFIDLVERFMPSEIDICNPKQLAMYELYHRLKATKEKL